MHALSCVKVGILAATTYDANVRAHFGNLRDSCNPKQKMSYRLRRLYCNRNGTNKTKKNVVQREHERE